jgi:LacI family transcriptional regulator
MGDAGAAHLATARLAELGHRCIGMIAGPSAYSLSGWRIEGWKRALAEAGLSHEGLLEVGDFGYESGTRAARALLDRNPGLTAIIASSDQMALAALEVARDRGLVVPSDLSLISFDNTPIVRFTQPPLTAIDQPIAETVSRAVEQLIARGDGDGAGVIEVPAALVERSSTAPAPDRA